MQFKKLLGTLIIFFITSVALAANSATKEIASDVVTIKSPQVEMEATGSTSTEVYMELINNGKQVQDLVAAYSPVAKQIQLHATVGKGKHEAMEQIRDISIAPHHEDNLRAGGLHVMLIGLTKQLNRGDIVPITLLFKDGSWIKIKVAVV